MPYLPNDGRSYVNISTNKTLAAADSGVVQNVIAAGVTITLPAAAAAFVGCTFHIRNGGVPPTGAPVGAGQNASITVNVTPNASDGISGNGFTAAVAKGAVSTAGSGTATAAQVGDEISITGSGVTGAAAWYVEFVKGLWTRQP